MDVGCVRFREAVALLRAAEKGIGGADSWLEWCEQRTVFFLPTIEFAQALAPVVGGIIRPLTATAPVLEVCAGEGLLAEALRAEGLQIVATDADPSPLARKRGVERASAAEALETLEPVLVRGCWVPADSGVDSAVMASPTVKHYLVINHSVNGIVGSEALWTTPGWTSERLRSAERYALCKFDYLGGPSYRTTLSYQGSPSRQMNRSSGNPDKLVQHTQVYLFSRVTASSPLSEESFL